MPRNGDIIGASGGSGASGDKGFCSKYPDAVILNEGVTFNVRVCHSIIYNTQLKLFYN